MLKLFIYIIITFIAMTSWLLFFFTPFSYENLFFFLLIFFAILFYLILSMFDFFSLIIAILYLGAVLFFFLFVLMTIDLRRLYSLEIKNFFPFFFFFLFFFIFCLYILLPSLNFPMETSQASSFSFFPHNSVGLGFFLYSSLEKEIYFLSILLFLGLVVSMSFTKLNIPKTDDLFHRGSSMEEISRWKRSSMEASPRLLERDSLSIASQLPSVDKGLKTDSFFSNPLFFNILFFLVICFSLVTFFSNDMVFAAMDGTSGSPSSSSGSPSSSSGSSSGSSVSMSSKGSWVLLTVGGITLLSLLYFGGRYIAWKSAWDTADRFINEYSAFKDVPPSEYGAVYFRGRYVSLMYNNINFKKLTEQELEDLYNDNENAYEIVRSHWRLYKYEVFLAKLDPKLNEDLAAIKDPVEREAAQRIADARFKQQRADLDQLWFRKKDLYYCEEISDDVGDDITYDLGEDQPSFFDDHSLNQTLCFDQISIEPLLLFKIIIIFVGYFFFFLLD